MNRAQIIEELEALLCRAESEKEDKEKEALKAAIAALQPWKRLSEETPDETGSFWVCDQHGELRERAFWIDSVFWKNGAVLWNVTHWCEINPPEDY